MRALVYTAPLELALEELPNPVPNGGEVVIRVDACGICGSDVHGFAGRSRIRIPPMVMGHEFVGHIYGVGAGVVDRHIGERVAVQPVIGCGECPLCRSGRPNICPHRRLVGGHRAGAFANEVAVPARAAYPVPSSLSDAAAVLVEPMSNAVHMLALGEFCVHQDVVVLGAGTLGLLTVALADAGGARQVVVTDVNPHRLEVAAALGADVTLLATDDHTAADIRDATDGGPVLVVDTAGFTASRRQAIEVVRSGGIVVLLGTGEAESGLPVQDVINREISLRGAYSSTEEEFRRAIEIMTETGIDSESWVQSARLQEGPAYFERLLSGAPDLVKVRFDF